MCEKRVQADVVDGIDGSFPDNPPKGALIPVHHGGQMNRPADLPDFKAPPLTEVAMSVQFNHLSAFTHVHIGLLWEKFRSRFPIVSYQPPLAPSFETFGVPQSRTPSFQIQFEDRPEIPRLWFADLKGIELIQFQPDRFIHNWRKTGDETHYPRYEALRERFVTEMAALQDFSAENGLGPLVPNQCEITYINTIKRGTLDVASMADIFRWWENVQIDSLGPMEDAGVQMSYLIPGPGGDPIGRLWVQSNPGLSSEGERVQMLSLIGRGPPASPHFDAVLDFFDNARARIVTAFAGITTENMHKAWGREA
ncbi:TIGR04255 family protein [Methylobacterium sp. E-025]|uniref:TIGR04255 family protein n=1 Tax=Methylobacterium sp. E-025 TaxID=2836561 RepID=UPI001FBAF187|nr:TIGR04255 family protein [Methylobacterium sp. E-025]MCJ2112847.1 TIGR04255 family protein [Methylobacterium sp. E-025]